MIFSGVQQIIVILNNFPSHREKVAAIGRPGQWGGGGGGGSGILIIYPISFPCDTNIP